MTETIKPMIQVVVKLVAFDAVQVKYLKKSFDKIGLENKRFD